MGQENRDPGGGGQQKNRGCPGGQPLTTDEELKLVRGGSAESVQGLPVKKPVHVCVSSI